MHQLGWIVQQLADLSHTERWPEAARLVSLVISSYRQHTDPEISVTPIDHPSTRPDNEVSCTRD